MLVKATHQGIAYLEELFCNISDDFFYIAVNDSSNDDSLHKHYRWKQTCY